MVDLMVTQNGPKYSTSSSHGAIGPIRKTIKLTVSATGIEKMKKAQITPFLRAENGSVDSPSKFGEQSL